MYDPVPIDPGMTPGPQPGPDRPSGSRPAGVVIGLDRHVVVVTADGLFELDPRSRESTSVMAASITSLFSRAYDWATTGRADSRPSAWYRRETDRSRSTGSGCAPPLAASCGPAPAGCPSLSPSAASATRSSSPAHSSMKWFHPVPTWVITLCSALPALADAVSPRARSSPNSLIPAGTGVPAGVAAHGHRLAVMARETDRDPPDPRA